jgi:hypothetical protein
MSRMKLLASRQEAEMEHERKCTIEEVICSRRSTAKSLDALYDQRVELRKAQNGALTALAAFNNALNCQTNDSEFITLAEEGFRFIDNGQRTLELWHSNWIHRGCKSSKGDYNIYDLVRNDDIFIRDEITTDNTMKISGIRLDIPQAAGWLRRVTSTRAGMYNITRDDYEWGLRKLEIMRERREANEGPTLSRHDLNQIFMNDREYVNDDDLLLLAAIEHIDESLKFGTRCGPFWAITSDEKMCRRIADYCSCAVYRLKPESAIVMLQRWGAQQTPPVTTYDTFDSHTEIPLDVALDAFSHEYSMLSKPEPPTLMLYDSGSVRAACIKITHGVDKETEDEYFFKFPEPIEHRARDFTRVQLTKYVPFHIGRRYYLKVIHPTMLRREKRRKRPNERKPDRDPCYRIPEPHRVDSKHEVRHLDAKQKAETREIRRYNRQTAAMNRRHRSRDRKRTDPGMAARMCRQTTSVLTDALGRLQLCIRPGQESEPYLSSDSEDELRQIY